MFSMARRSLLVASLKLSEGIHTRKVGMEGDPPDRIDWSKGTYGDREGMGEDPPDRIDWRERGAVTPVRNQLDCGACWAIAAVGSVEALHKIETGELVELSVQQVIDCDIESKGCEGVNACMAFSHISTFGITTEKAYPFTPERYNQAKSLPSMLSRLDKCDRRRAMLRLMAKPVVFISGYQLVETNEEALKTAVKINPVAVNIHINDHFREYGGDIIKLQECPPPTPAQIGHSDCDGHEVLVIGYDEAPCGTKYWICKNSWGEKWGENGFFRLQRGVENPLGVCGIHRLLGAYPIRCFVDNPTLASSCFKKLSDIFSFNQASGLWKSVAMSYRYGRLNSESLISKFGTTLLDLLRGKNSMVWMNACLEGHVSNSDGTDMMQLLFRCMQTEACDWWTVETVVPALANLQKDAYASSSSLLGIAREPEENLEKTLISIIEKASGTPGLGEVHRKETSKLDLDYIHNRCGLNIGSAWSPLVDLETTTEYPLAHCVPEVHSRFGLAIALEA